MLVLLILRSPQPWSPGRLSPSAGSVFLVQKSASQLYLSRLIRNENRSVRSIWLAAAWRDPLTAGTPSRPGHQIKITNRPQALPADHVE